MGRCFRILKELREFGYLEFIFGGKKLHKIESFDDGVDLIVSRFPVLFHSSAPGTFPEVHPPSASSPR